PRGSAGRPRGCARARRASARGRSTAAHRPLRGRGGSRRSAARASARDLDGRQAWSSSQAALPDHPMSTADHLTPAFMAMRVHDGSMREILFDRFGGPDVLRLHTDAPRPEPGEGEVLVQVAYAGLNPLDYKIRD